MSKVINIEQMSSWVLNKKHSEQTYVIEEYDVKPLDFMQ